MKLSDEFRNLIEHTIHDFEELNNFDLNITVNTEKLLSFTTNYKNINEVVEDASISKYSKYTYLDAASPRCILKMSDVDFSTKIYEPVMKLL